MDKSVVCTKEIGLVPRAGPDLCFGTDDPEVTFVSPWKAAEEIVLHVVVPKLNTVHPEVTGPCGSETSEDPSLDTFKDALAASDVKCGDTGEI